MVKIIRYRCEDGREFVEKKEAVEHEAAIMDIFKAKGVLSGEKK